MSDDTLDNHPLLCPECGDQLLDALGDNQCADCDAVCDAADAGIGLVRVRLRPEDRPAQIAASAWAALLADAMLDHLAGVDVIVDVGPAAARGPWPVEVLWEAWPIGSCLADAVNDQLFTREG